MSFCQKHRNHHCVHAHHCKDPEHLKKNSQSSTHIHNKTATQGRKVGQQDEGCHFVKTGEVAQKYAGRDHSELLKQVKQKQQKIGELCVAQSLLKQKNDKITQENKNLYTQIEYYREQFINLVANNTADSRNQIKKRIKETTDLVLRVKSLQNENNTLLNQNDKLRSQLINERTAKSTNKQINYSIEEKYNTVHGKLKHVDREKEDYRQALQSRNKEYESLEQRYSILKKEFSHQCQKYKKESRELNLQLELIKKEFSKYKSQASKQKQLFEIQKEKDKKKEELLKNKLQQFESKNKEYSQAITSLKQKCDELEEDLTHAKKVIEKNHQFGQQYNNLQSELNEKQVIENTVIKEHKHHTSNKQNKDNNAHDENQRLKLENNQLKEKIIQLQKKTTTNLQEIIMNMGASDAFKKLIEDKNSTIKKLMRQKTEIYNKAFLIQHP